MSYSFKIKCILIGVLKEQFLKIGIIYPNIFIIIDFFLFIHSLYIEYKTILNCFQFLIAILYIDPSNMDILTCLWLLNNICLLYRVYVEYINPRFILDYPKIHAFLDNLCTIVRFFNIVLGLYKLGL